MKTSLGWRSRLGFLRFRNLIMEDNVTDISSIDGLEELWVETKGDSRICIAILDGSVNQSHTSLVSANLTRLETLVSGNANSGSAAQHGTHVASIIFGQHDGQIKGIAPQCSGLIVPVFNDSGNGSIAPCTQIDLARAIMQAVEHGAHIINISGGQLVSTGEPQPILADAIRTCTTNNILIVAAAGNDGCNCLHVPAASPSVLAVGAMNSQGLPHESSNWGSAYQIQGILAPGENILGAVPSDGVATNSGTSYATPIVSGVAALLMSIQIKQGLKPQPHNVRNAILNSAIGCDQQPAPDCSRILTGRLNIEGALSIIIKEGGTMSSNQKEEIQLETISNVTENEDNKTLHTQTSDTDVQASCEISNTATSEDHQQPIAEESVESQGKCSINQDSVNSSKVTASGTPCGEGGPGKRVFALGQPGYDFQKAARRDSIMQHMDPPGSPDDPNKLLAYLENNTWDASAIIWTLNLDATPIYAIQARAPIARETYERLREFLKDQTEGKIERISVGGEIYGNTRLLSGQVVPIIWPELRCMYSWKTDDLVRVVCGSAPQKNAKRQEKEAYTRICEAVTNFLERVYYELRNLGTTSREIAINYAATNALNVERIFENALKEDMQLDTIEVEKSPICRMDSECYDVKLTFFNPSKVFEQARRVYLFTVDVIDIPVMRGGVRSFYVR